MSGSIPKSDSIHRADTGNIVRKIKRACPHGAAVNVAGRIESNTVGGQVLIGESTYRLVKEFVTADPPQTVMMKGLKRPLVSYPVTAMGPPYNIKLEFRADTEGGVEINLPFHCWKVEDKRIASESMSGETLLMTENLITASIESQLESFSDVKLIFDFCMDAHCFDDIYAKVLPFQDQEDKKLNRLRITSINQKDRDILSKWISEVS